MSDVPAPAAAEVGKKRRLAGVGFPSMPLGEAVALIRKIASFGNIHTDAAVASFLGHSTANSGTFRSKLAAMRDYGLLAGPSGELTVTPLALEILHPGLEADPVISLRAAFAKVKIFMTVFSALPTDHELELSGLANTAMHNHGIAPQSKDLFASSFVESGVLAGLVERVGTDHVRIPSNGSVAVAPMDAEEVSAAVEQDVSDQFPKNALHRAAAAAASAAQPPNAVVNHSWPIEGGVVRFIIESSITLPAAAYGVVGTVITAGDKLAELLSAGSSANTGDSADSE